jgi:hypothetical protein
MIARGESVDADVILQAIGPAGLDDESFAEMVGLFQKRADLRNRAALLEGAEREAAAIRAKIEREDAALAEARRRRDEAVRPLEEVLAVAERRVVDASTARDALGGDHNLPRELAKRRQAARHRLEKATNEHGRLKAAMDVALSWAKDSEAKLASYRGGPERAVADYNDGRLSGADGDGLAAKRLQNNRSEANRIRPSVESAAAAVAEARSALAAIEAEVTSL